MVVDTTQGPNKPFGEGPDETSRIAVGFASGGPVEFRPGEVNINLNALPEPPADEEAIVGCINDATGYPVELLDHDRERVARTGFVAARLDLGEKGDLLAVIARANAALGGPVLSPNTVFRIAAVVADPMRFASSFWADPMRFASFLADPMRFASMFGDPMRFANSSTARPAAAPVTPSTAQQSGAAVAVLDTGKNMAGGAPDPQPDEVDHLHDAGLLRDRPDVNADHYLDIAAGHTTFIHSIINRIAQPNAYWMRGVIHNDGDGAESDIALALETLYERVAIADPGPLAPRRLIVNLSFSGYYPGDREPPRVAAAIRALTALGVVVVAAAGNDGGCRKKFPAAMPEVLSVGSVGPCGPSVFSNFGPWVDVSAPGEDLVSDFFANFDGKHEPAADSSEADIDEFTGWAMWSGTSFSTATVVGVLASTIEQFDCSAREAVDIIVGQPGLFRLTDYGVLVNRIA